MTTVGNACQGSRSGPICNPATGECMQCLSDADCPTSARICNPQTHSCTACRGARDCPYSLPACASFGAPACNGLFCLADYQCPPEQVCVGSPAAGSCHCAADRGCGGNAPRCEDPTSGLELSGDAGFVGVCGCAADPSACPTGTTCNTDGIYNPLGACVNDDGGVDLP